VIHQEHRGKECRAGRLRNGQAIALEVTRYDVDDVARNGSKNEIPDVARAFADVDGRATRTLEPYERTRRSLRGERKDQSTHRLDLHSLAWRTDEGLGVRRKQAADDSC